MNLEETMLEELRQNFVEQYSAIPPPDILWGWITENFEPKSRPLQAVVSNANGVNDDELNATIKFMNFTKEETTILKSLVMLQLLRVQHSIDDDIFSVSDEQQNLFTQQEKLKIILSKISE